MDDEQDNGGALVARDARVNITYGGENGDLPDAVLFDSTDGDVKGWLSEALSGGDIPGIPATNDVDLTDFIVDRFEANAEVGYNRIMVRPKTPFGLLRVNAPDVTSNEH